MRDQATGWSKNEEGTCLKEALHEMKLSADYTADCESAG